MNLILTDDEARTIAKHLYRALYDDPFPFAPRLDPLKAILAKLGPPGPLPPLKQGRGGASDERGGDSSDEFAMNGECANEHEPVAH